MSRQKGTRVTKSVVFRQTSDDAATPIVPVGMFAYGPRLRFSVNGAYQNILGTVKGNRVTPSILGVRGLPHKVGKDER